jgi:hypothetical protein
MTNTDTSTFDYSPYVAPEQPLGGHIPLSEPTELATNTARTTSRKTATHYASHQRIRNAMETLVWIILVLAIPPMFMMVRMLIEDLSMTPLIEPWITLMYQVILLFSVCVAVGAAIQGIWRLAFNPKMTPKGWKS